MYIPQASGVSRNIVSTPAGSKSVKVGAGVLNEPTGLLTAGMVTRAQTCCCYKVFCFILACGRRAGFGLVSLHRNLLESRAKGFSL